MSVLDPVFFFSMLGLVMYLVFTMELGYIVIIFTFTEKNNLVILRKTGKQLLHC